MSDIKVITADINNLCVPCKDIMLYSGCRNSTDEKLTALCKECLEELREALTLRAVYTEVSVNYDGDSVDFGFYKAESKSLSKFLGDCSKVYFFAATIGIGADMLISRYSTLSPSKAVITDGCATAAIECFCDYLCSEVFGVPEQERFSPGYGDLPLSMQPEILALLSSHINIGLSMTDSMLLTPTKSVTAIVKSRKD
ncbi:MAG: Vitamin B12 dependent methionine synthase activation subunit [Ruminococcaceae bacterium]|nr:Vitamin B12 dependent methionine synthase activation subunit [Oscillospiraceae bacterium]